MSDAENWPKRRRSWLVARALRMAASARTEARKVGSERAVKGSRWYLDGSRGRRSRWTEALG